MHSLSQIKWPLQGHTTQCVNINRIFKSPRDIFYLRRVSWSWFLQIDGSADSTSISQLLCASCGNNNSSPTDLSPYIGHLSFSLPHAPKSDPSHGQKHCFPQPSEALCIKSDASTVCHHSNETRPSVENEGLEVKT